MFSYKTGTLLGGWTLNKIQIPRIKHDFALNLEPCSNGFFLWYFFHCETALNWTHQKIEYLRVNFRSIPIVGMDSLDSINFGGFEPV